MAVIEKQETQHVVADKALHAAVVSDEQELI